MDSGRVFNMFQWLLLLLVFSILGMAKSNNNLPGLRRNLGQDDDAISSSLQTFYYNQTLDHFNFQPQSFATFPQRYMIDSTYWGGAHKNAPIFVYLGNEMSLQGTLTYLGFLSDNAPRFKALTVYIEHRFYGKSVPFVSQREALKNETLRGYFNSAQALADYAELLLYLKKELSANYSPIIVVGASYGAMLATWFRLKYPHIAVGALASSAQFLLLDESSVPQYAFYRTIFGDFKESSKSCSETIKASWDEIHKVASKPDGLSILSQKFKSCRKLNNVSEVVTYLKHMYYQSATFGIPSTDVICRAIDEAQKETDVLSRVFSGIAAVEGKSSCYLNESKLLQNEDDTYFGLGWQSCSDLVFKFNYFGVDASFPPPPFNLENYIKNCESLYGLPPRPYWMNDHFGVHDMKLVLKRFGSNIIFTSGLRDPWSTGGILEDISHTIVAIVTKKGRHGWDILKARKTDPKWLVKQRNKSLKIIEGWIRKYYEDLRALNLK